MLSNKGFISGRMADGSVMPTDGIPNLAFDSANNRITTAGFQYDSAGNQTRALAEDGSWLRFQYDAANRLRVIYQDNGTAGVQAFVCGSTNARLIDCDYATGQNRLIASIGGTTLAEYTEYTGSIPTWTKSYTYLGSSQLSTVTPNGSGGEVVEYNHPDRLGTRLITNQATGTSSEQAHLPFGKALNAESTTSTSKRFTSYERSTPTGLDYAINRTYDTKQGRSTQVDPIGMSAVSLTAPQTLNMYTYCGNDPVNHTDPSGLFFGKFFKWLFRHLKKIFAVVAVIVAIVVTIAFPWAGPVTMKAILGLVGSSASAASSVFDLAGMSTFSKIFGFIALAAGIAAIGLEIKSAWQRLKELRAKSLISNFADDLPSIGTFFVEVRTSWDIFVSAVGSVSNQISIANGLSSLTATGSGVGSAQGGLANDVSDRLKCIGRVWWRSVPKTIETIVMAHSGLSLIGGGIAFGGNVLSHGIRSIGKSFWAAADGMSRGPAVGFGIIGAGGRALGHAGSTYLSNSANSINGLKRCLS